MSADPPHSPRDDQAADLGLSMVSDVETAVIEIGVRGRRSRRLCLAVHLAMRGSLAEHPSAIVVDLHHLNDLDAASTAMWLAASRAANLLRPPVRLILSLPPTRQLASRLRRSGAVRHLTIHPTTKRARDAATERLPAMTRLHLNRLPPDPASVGVAANALTVACAAWELPELAEHGRQIMMELVANAIVHAGTDMALTMSVRGTGLHVAVHDRDQRLPCLVDPAGPDPAALLAGRGWQLRTVQSQASAWGATLTREGKVVWAMVRPFRPASQRSGETAAPAGSRRGSEDAVRALPFRPWDS